MMTKPLLILPCITIVGTAFAIYYLFASTAGFGVWLNGGNTEAAVQNMWLMTVSVVITMVSGALTWLTINRR